MPGVRVLVLGATGGTGRHVVSLARRQGHTVTALVRNRDRLGDSTDVTVFEGDARDDDALARVVRDQDVVISLLGRGQSFVSEGLLADTLPRLVRAMEGAGVSRLIVVSAFGVGETYRDAPFLPRLFIRMKLRDIYADKLEGEKVVQRSALDWTIVYPTALVDAAPTGRWRAGERLALYGLPQIARVDLAAFVVGQIEDRTYLRKGVLVSR